MSSIPLCHCSRPSLSKEAFSIRNRGRWYWKCAAQLCDFFEWNGSNDLLHAPILHERPATKTIVPLKRRDDLNSGSNTKTDTPCPLATRLKPKKETSRQKYLPTIHLFLYTNTDVCVKASGRHGYIQTLFNTLDGIGWLEEQEMWVFAADQQSYQGVYQLLQRHQRTLNVIGIPPSIIKHLPLTTDQLLRRHQRQDDFDYDDTLTESNLWDKMDFEQQSRTRKGTTLKGNIYLQNDTASGHSLEALGIAQHYKANWPVLIICRSSACLVWKRLIQNILSLEGQYICVLDEPPTVTGNTRHSGKAEFVHKSSNTQQQKQQEEPRTVTKLSFSLYKRGYKEHPGRLKHLDIVNLTSGDGGVMDTEKTRPKDAVNYDEDITEIWIDLVDDSGDHDDPLTNIDDNSLHGYNDNEADKTLRSGNLFKKRKFHQVCIGDIPVQGTTGSILTNSDRGSRSGDDKDDNMDNIFCGSNDTPSTTIVISDDSDESDSNDTWIDNDNTNSSNNGGVIYGSDNGSDDDSFMIANDIYNDKKHGDNNSVDGDSNDPIYIDSTDIGMNSSDRNIYYIGSSDYDDSLDDSNMNSEDKDIDSLSNNSHDSMIDDTNMDSKDECRLENDQLVDLEPGVEHIAKFMIVSYDSAKTKMGNLLNKRYQIIIFDDCHDIKSEMIPDYRPGIEKLVNRSKKTIMISRIPIIPNPMDAFPLLQILRSDLFGDFRYFGKRYCEAKKTVFGWEYDGCSNAFELQYLLDRTVLVA